MGKKFYKVNQYIRAPQLRVLGEDGKQIGVFPVLEAQNLARGKGLDLVEIAPTARPPVAKLVDYKKFLYQEEKKERETKKKRGGEIKGIRVTPFMAKADLEVRTRRTLEFLKEGNKVRVAVRFMGRQLGKREFGYVILKKIIDELGTNATAEGEPKWMGRELVLVFSPIKGENNAKTENPQVSNTKV
ncbi:MAG: translation initiation factor IF-3 [bacterium]|nr:translation initiation factor IF-3 [bacterium]